MTYLEIVNKVLQRLREDTVNTVNSSPYSLLVGDFVNETIREVEDAHDWNSLKVTVSLPTESGTFRYSLTGANQRSKILSVYDGGRQVAMYRMNPSVMTKKYMTEDVTTGNATHYSQNGLDSAGVPVVDLYPIPDGTQTIYVNMKIPRDIITDGTTEIDLPNHCLILGAYAKAIQERGEDLGVNLQMALRSYEVALADAIAIDTHQNREEYDWYV